MRNPWRAKNPWMSMWLSSANVVWNTARVHAQRNASSLASKGYEDMLRAWTAAWMPPREAKRRRTRTR